MAVPETEKRPEGVAPTDDALAVPGEALPSAQEPPASRPPVHPLAPAASEVALSPIPVAAAAASAHVATPARPSDPRIASAASTSAAGTGEPFALAASVSSLSAVLANLPSVESMPALAALLPNADATGPSLAKVGSVPPNPPPQAPTAMSRPASLPALPEVPAAPVLLADVGPPSSAVPAHFAVAQAPASAFPASVRTSLDGVAATGELGAYEALARSARLRDVVAIARVVLTDAARARRSEWDFAAAVQAAADEAKISRIDFETPFGNVLKILGSGPEGRAESALAAAIWAHAIADARDEDAARLSGDILWLATHTAFDATSLLDRALGDEAQRLWFAIGEWIRRIDDGQGAALGRSETIVACAALAGSDSAVARRLVVDLAQAVHDATRKRLLKASAAAQATSVHFEGEGASAPRGRLATAFLGLTGLLFVTHALRLGARFALAYRQPAEVSLSEAGIRIKTRTELLGRVIREREEVLVRAGLVRVSREVRYPRAAFYAGLLALAVGSYVGVRAFVDGVRAASPSLLLTGLIVISLGIAADFIFGSLVPGARGRVRVVFVPRAGKSHCVADVDAQRAHDALDALARLIVTKS